MKLRFASILITGFTMGLASTSTGAWCVPNNGQPALQEQTQKQSQGAQQDSVAEAARKAREKAKTVAPAKKSYTNDTVSELRGNEISVVGSSAAKDSAPDQAKPAGPAEVKKDEAYWRKRFADLRAKLALAQRELDVAQRELNLLQTQYYADPNKALQQQLTRDDINAKTAKVDDKKAEVAELTQALEDLKDELRHAGGEPGWGN
jgi:chromosome segregation ATPase